MWLPNELVVTNALYFLPAWVHMSWIRAEMELNDAVFISLIKWGSWHARCLRGNDDPNTDRQVSAGYGKNWYHD
jgi:hypothetical protein